MSKTYEILYEHVQDVYQLYFPKLLAFSLIEQCQEGKESGSYKLTLAKYMAQVINKDLLKQLDTEPLCKDDLLDLIEFMLDDIWEHHVLH